MLEMASGFLERFELALVLGLGAVHFAMTALFAYTLQAISDKTDAAPAWMSWVPLVQMHPFIRAAGTTWTALLVWIVLLIAVTVLAAMASSSSYAGHAQFAGVLLILGSLFYFGRMMWRLAKNREVSGFVGLACPPVRIHPATGWNHRLARPIQRCDRPSCSERFRRRHSVSSRNLTHRRFGN